MERIERLVDFGGNAAKNLLFFPRAPWKLRGAFEKKRRSGGDSLYSNTLNSVFLSKQVTGTVPLANHFLGLCFFFKVLRVENRHFLQIGASPGNSHIEPASILAQ